MSFDDRFAPIPGEVDQIAREVVDSAMKVHRALGPGLLESVHETCLGRELELRHIPFKTQVPVPIEYEGIHVEGAFRLDVLVAGQVIVELKAVEGLLPVHEAQLLTYLKLLNLRLGLLINFNVPRLKEGIKRMVR